jgi:ubiquinone biosynthesis protein COQ4
MQGARVNLKGWQQAAVAFGSAFGALLDPRRADLIAALGETTGKPAFQRVLQRMRNSAEGRVNSCYPISPKSAGRYVDASICCA